MVPVENEFSLPKDILRIQGRYNFANQTGSQNKVPLSFDLAKRGSTGRETSE